MSLDTSTRAKRDALRAAWMRAAIDANSAGDFATRTRFLVLVDAIGTIEAASVRAAWKKVPIDAKKLAAARALLVSAG